MVAKAAELGHAGARGIVGWLHDSLGRATTALASEQTHLRHPTVLGNSSTAHRRLRRLGIPQRVDRSGLGYPGIRHSAAGGSQLPMETYIPNRTTPSQHVQRLLWGASCHGEHKTLRLLTTNRLPEINSTDNEGNTALLMASRHGHPQLVLHLLAQGADASLANSQGITALHYLSAFRDEDIQTVAQALLDNNASLDARAASRHTLFLDPIYPTPEGTPLAWAVAANNITAVTALVNLGADPFDKAGQRAQTSDRWTEFNRLSPVFIAVVRHQHELLGALFPVSRREAIPDLGNRLNNIRINVGSQGVVDTSLFAICARYDIEGLLPRLFLHGKNHKEAFKETFELLIKLGANPTETAHRGAGIIGIAVHFGQPFVVEYLMEWDGGRLRERSRVWYEMMIRAAQDSDRVIFDTLMKYEVMDQIELSEWRRFFVTMARETNDVHFLDPFAHKAREAGDLGPHLSIAIDAGNFETARWISTVSSTCDIVQPVGDDALSLLGRIILKSQTFDSVRSAIHAFLDLQDDPDQVFYNVMTMGESQLTALHVAALYLEYTPGSSMAGGIFETILDKFNEPRHLNFQLTSGTYRGYSPLHFALKFGNAEAVECMLQEVPEDEGEDGLDINLVNGEGETAMDMISRQFGSQNKWFDMWEVPEEQRQRLGIRHWDHTLDVFGALRKKGARNRKYIQVVLRPQEDVFLVFDFRPNQPLLQVPCRSKSWRRRLLG